MYCEVSHVIKSSTRPFVSYRIAYHLYHRESTDCYLWCCNPIHATHIRTRTNVPSRDCRQPNPCKKGTATTRGEATPTPCHENTYEPYVTRVCSYPSAAPPPNRNTARNPRAKQQHRALVETTTKTNNKTRKGTQPLFPPPILESRPSRQLLQAPP